MFTGIIESIGTVREFSQHPYGARARIAAAGVGKELRAGDSIAVDGACLTVTAVSAEGFGCDLSAETLARTTLGRLHAGARVNLERPLRLGDRGGGHFVTGHVDAVGQIVGRVPQGDGEFLRVGFPRVLAPLLVMKGSVAVDGISLTVAELTEDALGVALIPFTLEGTTLKEKRVGDAVNLEADLLGKYVARFLGERPLPKPAGGLSLSLLQEHGLA
ncbi:MAG TPA: riboflavin synthase [Candidatus Acidoferrum sp.]|nr:riboflavin synthase [Candidatus Acidoferrum sp.]